MSRRLPGRPRGRAEDAASRPRDRALHRRDRVAARETEHDGLRGGQGGAAFAGPVDGARLWSPGNPRGHVVIDGGIAGDKIIKGIPQFAQAMGEDGLISLAGLTDAYWYLYNQPKAAWTHELDLRPFKESF